MWEDLGLIRGLGRHPGGSHGNPLQCSCLENTTDRGAWWATNMPWGCRESETTKQLNRAQHRPTKVHLVVTSSPASLPIHRFFSPGCWIIFTCNLVVLYLLAITPNLLLCPGDPWVFFLLEQRGRILVNFRKMWKVSGYIVG